VPFLPLFGGHRLVAFEVITQGIASLIGVYVAGLG
jgi:hypothetical protein